MSAPLSHPHDFIISIISQLAKKGSPSGRGLSSLRRCDLRTAKSIFITLHFLFPHELLPALDLLDRKLVNQFVFVPTCDAAQIKPKLSHKQSDGSSRAPGQTLWNIFYVQSASAITSSSKGNSRYRRVYHPIGTYYEVRIDVWNCTCPAFAFSAFSSRSDVSRGQIGQEDEKDQTHTAEKGDRRGWRFGGTAIRGVAGVPICKHILAAVLGNALPGFFGQGVDRKEVTTTEVAGWGAGWGD